MGFRGLSSLIAICVMGSSVSYAADAGQTSCWHHISDTTSEKSSSLKYPHAEFRFDNTCQSTLNQLNKSLMTEIILPNRKGELITLSVMRNNTFPKALNVKYPEIASYTVLAIDGKKATGRLETSKIGPTAMYRLNDEWYFLDAPTRDNPYFRTYKATDANGLRPMFEDEVRRINRVGDTVLEKNTKAETFGDQLRTYRMAVGTTGEYTQYHGGTVAQGLAAVNTAINRINEVFRKEVAVAFTLVADNDQLIFTDASTDPYANSNDDLNTNRTVLQDTIGDDAFDIGHVFTTSGGGVAYLGVVCNNSSPTPFKGGGVSGLNRPDNDVFYVDILSHEVGHQLSANHSFNGGVSFCGDARRESAAYEPGSGSTIMSYSGVCGEQNIQNNADVQFHTNSIDEMRNYITNRNGATCGTLSTLNNNPPTASAGASITVPANTPFVLTGSGNDTDASDNLSYSWEQLDLGNQTFSRGDMVDDGSRPLFRVNAPSPSSTRYFPKLSDVINGVADFREVLPTTDREMNFRLTVRDGSGGVASDNLTVTSVSTAGPFIVTGPSSAGPFDGGSIVSVSWNVAGTNLAPISCDFVDINMSIDNGLTFSQPLLVGTVNDGTEDVTLPNIDVGNARIQVICSSQKFFNVNDTAFTVNRIEGLPSITGQSSLSIAEDSSLTVTINSITIEDSNTAPGNFTLTLYDGASYTLSGNSVIPDADYFGGLTVNASVNDGTYESALFPLEITVTPVNDAPVITNSNTLEVNEDNSISISIGDVTVTDVDDSTFSLNVLSGNNYTVNGAAITPTQDYAGSLSVNVTVNDGEADSASFAIPVNVNPINDNPVATNDQYSVTTNSSNNIFNVLTNDNDVDQNDQLSIDSVTYSGTGSLVINGSTLSYTPATDFSGSETFTYQISDIDGLTDEASATVTVSTPSSGGSSGGSLLWNGLLLIFLSVFRMRARVNKLANEPRKVI